MELILWKSEETHLKFFFFCSLSVKVSEAKKSPIYECKYIFWGALHWACNSLVFVHNLLCFCTNKLPQQSEPYWSSCFLFNPLLPRAFKRVHVASCGANEWGPKSSVPSLFVAPRVPSGWECLVVSCLSSPGTRRHVGTNLSSVFSPWQRDQARQQPRPWVSNGPLSYNHLVILYRHLQTIRMVKFGLRRYQKHSYVKLRGFTSRKR